MAKNDPFEKIESMFKELYDPQFMPEDIDLKAFYDLSEKEAKEDVERTYSNVRGFSTDGLPRNVEELTGDSVLKKPLSREEAEVVENKKEYLLQKAQKLGDQIQNNIESMDQECIDWSHTFNLSGRPKLRKAIRRVFGEKKSTITYQEFKDLLILKKQIEMAEAADLVREDDEDTAAGSDTVKQLLKGIL